MRSKQVGKGPKKPPQKKPSGSGTGGKRKRNEGGADMMNISEFEDTKVFEGNNYQEQAHTSKKKKKANRVTQKKKRMGTMTSDKPIVQIRQKTSHEKTLYYLEQILIKHQVTKRYPNLFFEKVAHGFDVYYRPNAYSDLNEELANNADGDKEATDDPSSNVIKFIKLINNLLPIRDLQNKSVMNGAFQKGKLGGSIGSVVPSTSSLESNVNENETYYIEIAPICTGDLICLPPRYYNSNGQIG